MPWKTVSILWPAVVAALIPLGLHDIITRLPRIAARLAALDALGDHRDADDRSRPRQVEDFRACGALRVRRAA